MFGKKKEELEREEFLKKRANLQALIDAQKLNSYGNRDELLNLPINDKIDAIFELLLLNSEYYTVNLLHGKYCSKKKKQYMTMNPTFSSRKGEDMSRMITYDSQGNDITCMKEFDALKYPCKECNRTDCDNREEYKEDD